ncbi:hypothetical protein EC5905_4401, partial [Escherichia coli 5905]
RKTAPDAVRYPF